MWCGLLLLLLPPSTSGSDPGVTEAHSGWGGCSPHLRLLCPPDAPSGAGAGRTRTFSPGVEPSQITKTPGSVSKPAAPPGRPFPRRRGSGGWARTSLSEPEAGTWCQEGPHVSLLSSLPRTPWGPRQNGICW